MTAAAYLVLLKRWMAAWVQDRRGPNRVGIPLTKIKMFGLGQPLADGLKFIFKEEFTPEHVDKALFRFAPIVIRPRRWRRSPPFLLAACCRRWESPACKIRFRYWSRRA